jgi:hypothetical protein
MDFKDLGGIAYAVSAWEAEDEAGNALDVLQRQSDGSYLGIQIFNCHNLDCEHHRRAFTSAATSSSPYPRSIVLLNNAEIKFGISLLMPLFWA